MRFHILSPGRLTGAAGLACAAALTPVAALAASTAPQARLAHPVGPVSNPDAIAITPNGKTAYVVALLSDMVTPISSLRTPAHPEVSGPRPAPPPLSTLFMRPPCRSYGNAPSANTGGQIGEWPRTRAPESTSTKPQTSRYSQPTTARRSLPVEWRSAKLPVTPASGRTTTASAR